MALVELAEVQGGVAGALDLVGGAVQVEDELGRDDADQYQHDQADTLLAVVGAMDEAYRHGGKHQHQAVPERRVLLLVEFATGFRGLVHLRQRTPPFQSEQDQRGDHEAGQRREDQRQADVDRLLPVDPSASGTSVISALARPTPRIEPIRVCELEAGMPKYQVPRFQAMAAASRRRPSPGHGRCSR